ncbi:MAG: nitroreductase family protein [Bacteroides sp.]|nr:nitroreductase family protein [Bacteroides sp.]
MDKNSIVSDKEKFIIDNILTRTSDRIFDPTREVENEKIDVLLKAAMAAPTGVNRQPWHFFVVTDKHQLSKLAETLPYCKMAKDAGVAIVVCGDKSRFLDGVDSTLWVQDVSASSENILLAAHALGLGSVWTALYPHPDRIDEVKGILDISDDFVPFNVIPIGYVKTPHTPLDKWNPEAVTFIK